MREETMLARSVDPTDCVGSLESVYALYRPLLFSIAYRMTGEASEAEDVVHDVFLRWQRLPEGHAEHPKAYLCRMTVRCCLDVAKSARRRREIYVGPWLPEPLPTPPEDGPLERVVRDETLAFGMLLLMEKLSPVERAVFVLREAFEYDYAAIAAMLDKTEAACRKTLSRVRAKLDAEAPAVRADPAAAGAALEAFHRAASTGDLTALFERLAPDVVLLSDGGGKVNAATVPIVARERVGAFVAGLLRMSDKFTFAPLYVNGGPAVAALSAEGVVDSLFALEAGDDGLVRRIYIVRNPDKLRSVSGQLRIP
ncbi:RNA polymerase sigma factor SigJ [Paenibacillus sp. TRM 82003]|nr:RNA polymerase sigma factor SigJ [Paenibacillus sp. TRM 82003]